MYINNQPIFCAETKEHEFLRDWRDFQYSLTDRLQVAKGDTELEIISQGWIKSTWWDNYLLKINDDLVFQREICMKYSGLEYWYARSIIPSICYNLEPEFFKRLEKESIRNLIFDNNQVDRVQMINYPIDHQCIEFHWVKRHLKNIDGILWLRLAEYSFLKSASFYLVEILLPELENVS